MAVDANDDAARQRAQLKADSYGMAVRVYAADTFLFVVQPHSFAREAKSARARGGA